MSPYDITRPQGVKWYGLYFSYLGWCMCVVINLLNPVASWIQEISQPSVTKINFKITLKFHSNLPGAQAVKCLYVHWWCSLKYFIDLTLTLRPEQNGRHFAYGMLTHCCLVTPYGAKIWVNIGSGNGLLPDGTKPLPEPILTFYH